MKVTVLQNIMNANNQIPTLNRELLDKNKVLEINILSSPCTDKTNLLIRTDTENLK